MTEQEQAALEKLGLAVGKTDRVIGKSKWDVLAPMLDEPGKYISGFSTNQTANTVAGRMKKVHKINCRVRFDINIGIIVIRVPDDEVVPEIPDTETGKDEEE